MNFIIPTYQCLDHEHTPLSHVVDKLIDIDIRLFGGHSVQHAVQGDECTSATNASTAVDHELATTVLGVTSLHATDERDE